MKDSKTIEITTKSPRQIDVWDGQFGSKLRDKKIQFLSVKHHGNFLFCSLGHDEKNVYCYRLDKSKKKEYNALILRSKLLFFIKCEFVCQIQDI